MACGRCRWWSKEKNDYGRCTWEDHAMLPDSWSVTLVPYPPLMQASEGEGCPQHAERKEGE